MTFGPSGGAAVKTEITVCEHSLPWHPQMQVRARSCKEDDKREHDPEKPPSCLPSKLISNGLRKSGKVLWSVKSKLGIYFGNHGKRRGTIRLIISVQFKSMLL